MDLKLSGSGSVWPAFDPIRITVGGTILMRSLPSGLNGVFDKFMRSCSSWWAKRLRGPSPVKFKNGLFLTGFEDRAITMSIAVWPKMQFCRIFRASGIAKPLNLRPLTLTISSPTVKRPSLKIWKFDNITKSEIFVAPNYYCLYPNQNFRDGLIANYRNMRVVPWNKAATSTQLTGHSSHCELFVPFFQ